MSSTMTFTLLGKDKLGPVFDSAGRKADSAGSKFTKFGKIAGVGLVAAGTAAVVAGPKILGLAGSLELMGKKASIVFGDQIGQVGVWSKANAAAMGLTAKQATGLAANFGDLLIPMGFSRKEAAKMATQVVGLSGALSQWSGGTKTAEEVSVSLSKAMLGEREELKALGISISEADVSTRLLEKGQKKLTGTALQQAKAVATQELIFEKSKDAQAAYAKGSDSLLGKQAHLSAQFKTFGETLLIKATPALHGFMTFAANKGIPAVTKLAAGARDTGDKFRSAAGWIAANEKPIKIVGGLITAVMLPHLIALGVTATISAGKQAAAWTLTKVSAGRAAVVHSLSVTKMVLGWAVLGTKSLLHAAKVAAAWLIALGPIGLVIAAVGLAAVLIVKHWGTIRTKTVQAWRAVSGAVRTGVDAAVGFVRAIPGRVTSALSRAGTLLVNRGRQVISGLVGGFLAYLRAIGGIGVWLYRNVVRPAVALFAQAHLWLLNAGKNVLGGFWVGMTSKWSEVTKWVSGIATWIREHKGPISLDAKLLFPAGQALMSGFLRGLKAGAGPAWRFVSSVGGKSVNALREALAHRQGLNIPPGILDNVGGLYRRTTYRGKPVNVRTARMLMAAEKILGSPIRIMQGSFQRASSFSGTTHTGGGVVDTDGPGGWARTVAALRAVGFAAWHRTPAQGPWGHHIHAVGIGDLSAAASAKRQVVNYGRGGDGLAGYGRGGFPKAFETFWVGERGPELMRLGSRPAQVIPNHQIPSGIDYDRLARVMARVLREGLPVENHNHFPASSGAAAQEAADRLLAALEGR